MEDVCLSLVINLGLEGAGAKRPKHVCEKGPSKQVLTTRANECYKEVHDGNAMAARSIEA